MEKAAILASLTEKLKLETGSAKILVVGLGVTGLSVAHFLRDLGFNFAVADSRDKPPMIAEFQAQMPDTPVFLGGFDDKAFSVATHLVISPGVPLSEKAVAKAMAQGVKAIGDIDLFVCAVSEPIIAITGSNGKSTVTTMVGDIAKATGKRVGVGGNLGTPALDLLAQNAELFVLELSSFQLERTSLLNAAASAVLNVSADHLDRHPDVDAYAKEKQRIYHGDGIMVINLDDPLVRSMQLPGRRTLTFSIKDVADFYLEEQDGVEYLKYQGRTLMARSELPLVGRHNVANALAAMALATAAGLDALSQCAALRKYKGLAHRMQWVAEIQGVTWVNDSKATNIGACVAALQGCDRKVILIAGGDAKGADMTELLPAVREKAKCVVLIGRDAKLIDQALAGCVPVYFAESMAEAVKTAAGQAVRGDSVLLSPACASLDQYKNYQDRGNKFTQAVLEMVA